MRDMVNRGAILESEDKNFSSLEGKIVSCTSGEQHKCLSSVAIISLGSLKGKFIGLYVYAVADAEWIVNNIR